MPAMLLLSLIVIGYVLGYGIGFFVDWVMLDPARPHFVAWYFFGGLFLFMTVGFVCVTIAGYRERQRWPRP